MIANVDAWRARMPAAFGATPARRALRVLGWAVFTTWLVGSLWWFDMTTQAWAGRFSMPWADSSVRVMRTRDSAQSRSRASLRSGVRRPVSASSTVGTEMRSV